MRAEECRLETYEDSLAAPRNQYTCGGGRRGAFSGAHANNSRTSVQNGRGNCYDDTVIESWLSTVKSEEGERFKSCAQSCDAAPADLEGSPRGGRTGQ